MHNPVSCVTVILYNSQGQVLLYQRDDKPELSFAGHWSTLGGIVEANETPTDAMRRELKEEIEIEVAVDFWKVFERTHSSGTTILQHVFVGHLDRAAKELTLREGQALAYFKQEELDELPIGFGFGTLLKEFYQTYNHSL